jgi:hypothetical protein
MRLVTRSASSSIDEKGPTPQGAGPFRVLAAGSVLLALFLLAHLSATADPVPEPGDRSVPPTIFADFDLRIGAVRVAPTVELEPIQASEILSDNGHLALSAGTYAPGGFGAGIPGVEARIVRTIPALWWMRLRDERDLDNLDVRVDLSATDGGRGRLAHGRDEGSQIRVEVRPLEPVVTIDDTDSVVVEGGALLILDLTGVRAAGTYNGTLTVTVDQF